MAPRALRLLFLRALRTVSCPETVAQVLGIVVLSVGLVLTWLLVDTFSERERQERETAFRHSA